MIRSKILLRIRIKFKAAAAAAGEAPGRHVTRRSKLPNIPAQFSPTPRAPEFLKLYGNSFPHMPTRFPPSHNRKKRVRLRGLKPAITFSRNNGHGSGCVCVFGGDIRVRLLLSHRNRRKVWKCSDYVCTKATIDQISYIPPPLFWDSRWVLSNQAWCRTERTNNSRGETGWEFGSLRCINPSPSLSGSALPWLLYPSHPRSAASLECGGMCQ
ncbi:hypothetical protein XELAEV_18031945mg [Xenopus laevis]|uniref:Uncharacterized protein n=1 Tax=Xenopus laevis TaxID=8355 RepID=A0A974HG71_XENLA|nr:hypothetical protein XELAEV_18031945mg [Xenopus laevis]